MNFLRSQAKVRKWVRMNLWTLMNNCSKKWRRKAKMKLPKSWNWTMIKKMLKMKWYLKKTMTASKLATRKQMVEMSMMKKKQYTMIWAAKKVKRKKLTLIQISRQNVKRPLVSF